MANSATILKNGISEVVYRFVNDSATAANFTISLAALARTDQAISGTPTVALSNMSFNTTSAITISRNSQLEYYLTGTGEHTFAYCSDYQNSTSDIVVSIASGTLILRLSKGSEYYQSA